MIKREIEAVTLRLFSKYPVITITGPRQSGKTTLAKKLFPGKPYINLEYPDQRRFAVEDARGFLNRYPDGAVLDEIQRTPELPSYLQGIVDEKKRNAMFVLTGSRQFEVTRNISQSLAGRTAMVRLLPLSAAELASHAALPGLNELLVNGFFPGLHVNKVAPRHFYASYFETYIERDLRQLSQIENLRTFDKFVRLLAARTGGLLNHQSIANDCGVSQPTIRKWISILEAGFIVFLLPPFFRNIGKRLIKTPKVYFLDTGLLCFLLGVETAAHLAAHPLRGAVFENFIVAELLKKRYNDGLLSNIMFFRDRAGNEVDAIVEEGRTLLPIEIKSSQTASLDFTKSIDYFRALFPNQVKKGLVVYDGSEEAVKDRCEFINWKDLRSRI
jgi:predicted AAA+ superfamily ATPase